MVLMHMRIIYNNFNMFDGIILFWILVIFIITVLIFVILLKLSNKNKNDKIQIYESIKLFFIWWIILLFLHSFIYSVWINLSMWLFILSSFIVPAIMEEIWKFLWFWIYYKNKIKSVMKTIYWIWFTALWFAFFENLTYIISSQNFSTISEMLSFSIYRWLISSLSHILFSMIIWYFLWKTIFYRFLMINSKMDWIYSLIKKISKKINVNYKLLIKIYSLRLIFYWFTISILLHILYNLSASNNFLFLSIIILLIIILYFIFFVEDEYKYSQNYLDIHDKNSLLTKVKKIKKK